MSIKKRGAVIAVVSLMLCVAVYLNWSYTRSDEDLGSASDVSVGKTLGEAALVDKVDGKEAAEAVGSQSDYFAEARLSRQKARDESTKMLKEITQNEKSTDAAIEKASNDIAALAANSVREARIENLIKAKGFKECVVFINDTGVNVIVSKTDTQLKSADTAKIKDIVIDETKVKADKIKIVEASA